MFLIENKDKNLSHNEFEEIISGVPQGSIWVLFFLIYTYAICFLK